MEKNEPIPIIKPKSTQIHQRNPNQPKFITIAQLHQHNLITQIH